MNVLKNYIYSLNNNEDILLGKIIEEKSQEDKLKGTINLVKKITISKKRYIKLLFIIITPLIILTVFQISAHILEGEKIFAFNTESRVDIADQNSVSITQNNSSVAGEFTRIFETKQSNAAKSIDFRAYVLDKFFESQNSPLAGTGQIFADACDRYGAPASCITLVAISGQETDFCKYYTSAKTYNCLGWGGPGVHRVTFNSFDHMIDTATDVLVNQYGYELMINVDDMQDTYCGTQDECEGWSIGVRRIMNQIDQFSVDLGFGKLSEI